MQLGTRLPCDSPTFILRSVSAKLLHTGTCFQRNRKQTHPYCSFSILNLANAAILFFLLLTSLGTELLDKRQLLEITTTKTSLTPGSVWGCKYGRMTKLTNFCWRLAKQFENLVTNSSRLLLLRRFHRQQTLRDKTEETEMTSLILVTKHCDKLKPVWRHPRRVSIVSQRKHQQNHCRNWNTKTLIFRRKCENENEDSNVFKTHSSVSRFRLERFFAFSSPTKAATFKNTLKTDSLMNKINHSDFWI